MDPVCYHHLIRITLPRLIGSLQARSQQSGTRADVVGRQLCWVGSSGQWGSELLKSPSVVAAGDWAFAAVAAIESRYLIDFGGDPVALHLSEQELLSCCNSQTGFPGSKGCSGGNSDDVSI